VTGGFPKQRATVNLSWNSGDWSATWAMTYIGHMIEDCNGVFAFFGSHGSLPRSLVKSRCTG